MFIRCIVVFLFSGIGIAALDKDIYPKFLKPDYEPKEDRRTRCLYFWFRQLAGNSAYFLNILTMSRLPLGITMILFNTAPFWSVIFGKIINGSLISTPQILLMCGSFVGVVIVAISNFVYPKEPAAMLEEIPVLEIDPSTVGLEQIQEIAIEKSNSEYFVGVIFGIIAAFCFSLLGVFTRKSQPCHPSTMLFSYSIFGFLGTVIILTIESLVNWTPWRFTSYTSA
jgi:drug/metabolite transporter (DMT)-like permease